MIRKKKYKKKKRNMSDKKKNNIKIVNVKEAGPVQFIPLDAKQASNM